jgi:hypothetical protein
LRKHAFHDVDFRTYYTGGARITGFVSHWMTLSGEQMMVLILLAALLLFGRWNWLLASCGAVIAASLVLEPTGRCGPARRWASATLVWLRDKRASDRARPVALLLLLNPREWASASSLYTVPPAT